MNIISKGIDISHWQGNFDLAKAKSDGFAFAVVKAGGSDNGRYVDSRFTANYDKAKAQGMPVGVYWYTDARTVDAAVTDADYLYERCLKGRQFELPIYFDVEGKMLGLGRRLLTDIVHAWCQRMEALGFWAGIYASTSTFRGCMYDDELQRYAHWVAQWSKSCSYDRESLGMWQYGGETNMICSNKVAGQTCDQDYMLVDYPTLIKRDGKNGFTASDAKEETAKAETETVYTQEQFVRDIQTACGAKVDGIAGAETLGKTVTLSTSKNRTHAAVKPVQQRLKALGFDPGNADGIYGSKTKAAVKAYQKANGCTQDGIITAGNKTWRKLLGIA